LTSPPGSGKGLDEREGNPSFKEKGDLFGQFLNGPDSLFFQDRSDLHRLRVEGSLPPTGNKYLPVNIRCLFRGKVGDQRPDSFVARRLAVFPLGLNSGVQGKGGIERQG